MTLADKLRAEDDKRSHAKGLAEGKAKYKEQVQATINILHKEAHAPSCNIPLFFSDPTLWNKWLESCILHKRDDET